MGVGIASAGAREDAVLHLADLYARNQASGHNLGGCKMKAILVREFGGPDVLKLEEVRTPKPAAGEVLVRIHAAGVNPYDTYMRAGSYARKPALPYTPGSDGAGVVEAVGEGVKKVKQGERALGHHTGRRG
jgi:NADPH:quinone reductase-like Zn-dependent oxidoreductase